MTLLAGGTRSRRARHLGGIRNAVGTAQNVFESIPGACNDMPQDTECGELLKDFGAGARVPTVLPEPMLARLTDR